MDLAILPLSEHYQGLLSLWVFLGAALLLLFLHLFYRLVPVLARMQKQNKQVADSRNVKDSYRITIRNTMLYGFLTQLVFFSLMLPFMVTAEPRQWWDILLDIVILLMFYDFIYYLTHRFLFHDGPLGGPLIAMHAVHHQKKNPCRLDSSYLHPLEAVIGLALFAASITVLALLMGKFHVVTLIVSCAVFIEFNQHNHD